MREIDITKQDIRCFDGLEIDIDCIIVEYELWFNVDKYFGTHIESDDSTWLNFYTYWYPDGRICAVYEIDTDTDVQSYDWELTDEEKVFFLNKMEEYCKSFEGKSLMDLWKEWN